MPKYSSANKPLRVGVTGHRKLGPDPRVEWYVWAQCVRILADLQRLAEAGGRKVEAYSALAIGADQVFAKAALGLRMPLVGVVPFEDYVTFFNEQELLEFNGFLSQCARVERLPRKRKPKTGYLEGGRYTVDQTEFLVAIWDGRPAKGKGGTGDIVAYAEKKGRTVFRINLTEAMACKP